MSMWACGLVHVGNAVVSLSSKLRTLLNSQRSYRFSADLTSGSYHYISPRCMHASVPGAATAMKVVRRRPEVYLDRGTALTTF